MPTAQRTFALLDNETLWDAALASHTTLAAADVPHAILGGVAVCLHGYQRNTVDIDLVVRNEDHAKIRQVLGDAEWAWDANRKEFLSPAGIQLQFLTAGQRAGSGSLVRLPDPADRNCITELEGLPVLTLARLIESKLAAGEGSPRRMHKDFADVVELISHHRLSRSFARHLDKSLQQTFRELVLRSRDE